MVSEPSIPKEFHVHANEESDNDDERYSRHKSFGLVEMASPDRQLKSSILSNIVIESQFKLGPEVRVVEGRPDSEAWQQRNVSQHSDDGVVRSRTFKKLDTEPQMRSPFVARPESEDQILA